MIDSVVKKELTRREIDALQLAADGNQFRQVGEALGISPFYVKTVWHSARNKLGADTLVQAVAMALRRGLIQ